ncbi:hypothetical protein CEP52_005065 [Fusarium oligoseptatum]|uniref:Uncharacterized protein n=1 Tax=Fusarium oligoseptatum TaxID=2604345 RepID=A0A428U0E4_9HYPO|nr:hypothetical protein CEP52_005065 [Fusarium oligoseptatum]
MHTVATRLESRRSLLGPEHGYGYGGHYNQPYSDGEPAPQPIPQPAAFTQPTFGGDTSGVDPAANQGYAYREGFSPSVPATSTLNGKTGFLTSRWPACFMTLSLLQAVLCICFEAYIFGKFQFNLGPHINLPKVIGVCFSNLALMVYTAIQVDQIKEAFDILGMHNALEKDVTAADLWGDVKPYLVAIPAIIAAATVGMIFISWKIYQEYAWDILKNIGADYRMKKRFLHYQIYIALLKFDFFFFLGFIVQFVVVVAEKNDPEFALTIVTIPITIAILLAAAYFTRRENKPGMVCVIILYLGGLSYFLFKLVRIYQPGHKEAYEAVRRSLTAFAVITILLILLTIANAIVCMCNFGKGLKPHLQSLSRKRKVEEKPDINSINMQDVKPQAPSRMTID